MDTWGLVVSDATLETECALHSTLVVWWLGIKRYRGDGGEKNPKLVDVAASTYCFEHCENSS